MKAGPCSSGFPHLYCRLKGSLNTNKLSRQHAAINRTQTQPHTCIHMAISSSTRAHTVCDGHWQERLFKKHKNTSIGLPIQLQHFLSLKVVTEDEHGHSLLNETGCYLYVFHAGRKGPEWGRVCTASKTANKLVTQTGHE